MSATDSGSSFVDLATIGALATLIGVVVWLLAVVVKGLACMRAATDEAPATTPR